MSTHAAPEHNIIYGDRILIQPNYTPDSSKYIQWSDNLPLLHTSPHSHSIIAPFDFEKVDEFNRNRQKVGTSNWRKLYTACIELGITPPTFVSKASQQSPALYTHHRKRKLERCSK